MDSTRDRWLPLAAAAGIAVVGAIEVALSAGYAEHRVTAALVVVVAVAGLAVAARWPVAGTAVVAGMFPVAVLGGLSGPTGAGVFTLLLSPGWAGYRAPPRRSWPAPLAVQLTASAGTFVVGSAAGSDLAGLGAQVWENLFFTLVCWGAWGVGVLARRLRERAEVLARLAAALDAEREARERAVVVEERQRIAREVHDVVAHSISVMVLQLGALRSTMPAGPGTDVLLGVERLGRESVAELRSLVGILRETPEGVPPPQPTLARLPDLAAEVRAAGLPVELRAEGEVDGLPRGLDLSAYRIVQEALTNVLRHAGPVPTVVTLRRSPDQLVVEVENEPARAVPVPATGGGGHGLVGMRERVSVFGGALDAGPRPDGGFRVQARFPLGAGR